jgi:hypothetical protein
MPVPLMRPHLDRFGSVFAMHSHGGEHMLVELIQQLFGKARVDQISAWFFIFAGILMPVFVPIRVRKVMKPGRRLWPVVVVSLVFGVALVALGFVLLSSKDKLANYAIEDAGGTIVRDDKVPGRPVIRVDFEWPLRRGYDLASLRPHLENLPELRHLRITRRVGLSGADLVHLQGLKQVKSIELYAEFRQISKSAVERLQRKLPDARIVYTDPEGSFPAAGPPLPFPLPRR